MSIDRINLVNKNKLTRLVNLAFRMRRLSDLLPMQIQDLLDNRSRDFKFSWLIILSTISREEKIDFKTLANHCNVTAAAISQSMYEIEKLELVNILKGQDRRSRIISLTSKGQKLLDSVGSDLSDIETVLTTLVGDENVDPLIDTLSNLEQELRASSLKQRLDLVKN